MLNIKTECCPNLKVKITWRSQDYLHFHVPDPKTPWSYLFLTMEGAKQLFTDEIVTDYSVSETSLEEVFISFAQHQRLASPGKTS